MSAQTGQPPIEGDRTVSPAAGTGWWTTQRKATIGGGCFAVLCLFTVWKTWTPAKPDKDTLPEKPTLAFATQNPYHPPPADPPPPEQKTGGQQQQAPAAAPPPDFQKATSKPGGSGSGSITPVFYSYTVPALPDQFKPKGSAAANATSENGVPTATAIAYKAAQIPGFKAGSMGDTALMLPPGVVSCTMSSVIESTVEGDFTCTIRNDVKSPAGVVLLDAGSYIQGTYDIHVQTGQRRLRAGAVNAWDLKTNCVVPLGGAMSDGLGRAGLDGDYDPHTWEKLGAAGIVMLTQNAFNLATAALQSALQGGSNNRNSNNSSGNSYYQVQTGDVQSIVSELLRANASIPPTITVHQGSVAGFWLKEPTDFSACYRLATVN